MRLLRTQQTLLSQKAPKTVSRAVNCRACIGKWVFIVLIHAATRNEPLFDHNFSPDSNSEIILKIG